MDLVMNARAALVAASLILTACGVAATGTAAPKPQGATPTPVEDTAAKTWIVTPGIKGNSVSVGVGDELEIRVPTIPRAGFEWQPQNLDASMLRQLGKPVFQTDSATGSTGGIVTLRFRVVAAGTTTLTILYAATQESGGPAIYSDSFGLTVTAR
jgi:predicted secreted protein